MSAEPTTGGRAPSEEGWPAPLNLRALAERQPQPPRFVLADWLPIGYATLLAGPTGTPASTFESTSAGAALPAESVLM